MEARPYWHSYPDFLSETTCRADRRVHPLLMEREEKTVVVIVLTSDKGLCGAFNSNLLEKASAFLEEKVKTADVRSILIGKKAEMFFKNLPYPTDRVYSGNVEKLTREDLRELTGHLIQLYAFSQADAVYIVYNEFKSILAPRITVTKLLPIEGAEAEKLQDGLAMDWEPDLGLLFNTLLPLYVETQVFHAFFESSAAEQAARMMAMDNATQNAEDLIEELTLVLNKVRQASITKELLEIMTAVEALAKR
jgi:F-type H+-transporting ATPase subunit gamma